MTGMEDNLRRLKALQKKVVRRSAILDQYHALRRDLGIDRVLRKLNSEESRQLKEMCDLLGADANET